MSCRICQHSTQVTAHESFPDTTAWIETTCEECQPKGTPVVVFFDKAGRRLMFR